MSFIFGRFHPTRRPIRPDDPLPTISREAQRWQQGPIALGYYPAAIGDSAEYPHHDPTSRLTLVASLRLDNRTELRKKLSVPLDQPVRDGQLLLLAYQRWGIDCPIHLLGDFAFVIWDQDQQRLFAARDFIGTRPLYYTHTRDRFLFASTAAAIATTEGLSLTLNEPYVVAHFRQGLTYPHPTETFYEQVRKLAPGYALTVSDEAVRTWRFWHPERLPDIRYRQEADYALHLRELMTDAVAVRLPSAGVVAAHLSSGLDCTSIAVIAQRMLKPHNRMLYGYCWSPPPDGTVIENDERHLVEQVARAEQIPVVYAQAAASETIRYNYLWHLVLEEDDAYPFELSLRHHAVANRVSTILSGWGGDQFISFNGRGFPAYLFRKGRWGLLAHELKQFTDWKKASRLYTFFRMAVVPNLPDEVAIRWARRSLPYWWRRPMYKSSLIQPELLARWAQTTPLPQSIVRMRADVRQNQLAILNQGYVTMRLEGWAAAGLRQGFNYAYPLLDRRVVEFALSIPPDMFFKNGWQRHLFRTAMAGILPSTIAWKKEKRDPALDIARKRLAQQIRPKLLQTLHQLLATDLDMQILDLSAARQLIAARLNGDQTLRGHVASIVCLEMLMNPALYNEMQNLG